MRKAIAALKKQQPDFIVAEFFYGYGNNYAGVNISNLDVLLYSLQKYSADTKVIVLVDKDEYKYVGKLNEIIKLHDTLKFPVNNEQLQKSLILWAFIACLHKTKNLFFTTEDTESTEEKFTVNCAAGAVNSKS